MREDDQLRVRHLVVNSAEQACFYSKTLFYDEESVAGNLLRLRRSLSLGQGKVSQLLAKYTDSELKLSEQQLDAVEGVSTTD